MRPGYVLLLILIVCSSGCKSDDTMYDPAAESRIMRNLKLDQPHRVEGLQPDSVKMDLKRKRNYELN